MYIVYFPYPMVMEQYAELKAKLRLVNDFPTPGVEFYDITPLFEDTAAFRKAIDGIAAFYKTEKIDKVVGIDARGFLVASPVAYVLGAGLALVRKKGKLPSEIIREHHELEYGKSALEIHVDAIKKGERVVIVDDVLATGGTAGAALRLVENLGGIVVGLDFLVEITKFEGRKRFPGHIIHSLVVY